MTNKEKLEKAYELIDEANKLIDEVANSEPEVESEDELEDPVAEYKKRLALCDKSVYFINFGDVSRGYLDEFDEDDYNPYFQFLDGGYAYEAAEHYKLICMQLAFKWCHDRDYVPDWTSDHEFKYYVYYDTKNHAYIPSYIFRTKSCTEVYFSSEEIAQKCADWLNSQLGGGDNA